MKNKVRYLFADKANTLNKPLYLTTVGKVALAIGLSATPIVSTYNVPVVSMYFTCASTNTGTSFQPVIFNTIMTGVGQVGGRVRVNMESNVRLGAWTNVFKASMDWKTNGSMSGLGSVICAEMTMMASDPPASGEYPVLELEIAMPDGHAGDNKKDFIYCGVTGDNKSNLDTYGYLLNINGVSDGNFYHSDAPGTLAAGLRIMVGTTPYWIGLYSAKDD